MPSSRQTPRPRAHAVGPANSPLLKTHERARPEQTLAPTHTRSTTRVLARRNPLSSPGHRAAAKVETIDGQTLDWTTYIPGKVPGKLNAAKHPVFAEVYCNSPSMKYYGYSIDFHPLYERLLDGIPAELIATDTAITPKIAPRERDILAACRT